MQFIHYAACSGIGVAAQREFRNAAQRRDCSCKWIAARLHAEIAWRARRDPPRSRNGGRRRTALCGAAAIFLRWDRLKGREEPDATTAPAIYASLIRQFSGDRRIEYGELTFFGDTRYSARGRAVRAVLDRAAERLFRGALKMPVDVYEGPAMNHSYHEMIIGCGKCFSTILIAGPDNGGDYHDAQFLATQMALAERGRAVVSDYPARSGEHDARGAG